VWPGTYEVVQLLTGTGRSSAVTVAVESVVGCQLTVCDAASNELLNSGQGSV
jgi:hypothetical protein